MPITIEGTPFKHVGGEADHAAEAVAAKLGKVYACTDSERHADEAGNRQDDDGSHDRICHAAARFADGLRSLRQERPVDRTNAAIQQIAEDGDQRCKTNRTVRIATPVMTWSVMRRRKLIGEMPCCRAVDGMLDRSDISPRRLATGYGPHQQLRQRVHDDRDNE